MKKNELVEPMAKKVDKILKMHDHERNDEFYWLNERGNQEVIDYLNAENDYRDAYMKDYKSLENELFEEIKSRIKEDDTSVPYLDNGYYYYTRYEKGKQYPIYCRKKDDLSNPRKFLLMLIKCQKVMNILELGELILALIIKLWHILLIL